MANISDKVISGVQINAVVQTCALCTQSELIARIASKLAIKIRKAKAGENEEALFG